MSHIELTSVSHFTTVSRWTVSKSYIPVNKFISLRSSSTTFNKVGEVEINDEFCLKNPSIPHYLTHERWNHWIYIIKCKLGLSPVNYVPNSAYEKLQKKDIHKLFSTMVMAFSSHFYKSYLSKILQKTVSKVCSI